MKATAPRSRGRRPKLKVVGCERRPPRHRVVYGTFPGGRVLEFWSEAEWEALESWERPDADQVAWLPGVGHIHQKGLESQEEHDEAYAEYCDAWRHAADMRELMEL